MRSARPIAGLICLFVAVIAFISCDSSRAGRITDLESEPVIEPDYTGVTIPPNIAPMNFRICEEASSYIVNITSIDGEELSIRSGDGIVRFPERAWKRLLENSKGERIEIEVLARDKDRNLVRYRTFNLNVAREPIDPYLCYRLLYPGYEKWYKIVIRERNNGNFKERSVVENQLLDNNCINCHSFSQNDPGRFLIHVRGSKSGTYFVDRNKITKTDLKTGEMASGAVYPAWHPEGRFVMFSSNNVKQSFHAVPEKNIEVLDLSSSLMLYDMETNEMIPVHEPDTVRYMETFPEWSPDGGYIYYCRAKQYEEGSDFTEIRYNLVRKAFDPGSRCFGRSEIVFDAVSVNKSVSFPRISPDGKYLVFTLHNYGTFSIWHREADLYLIDLQSGETCSMNLNSDETESYHSWSSNSKWLVFSSKRGDGLTARPYFAYIGSKDQTGKPFVLPQRDPTLYSRMLKTFNKPEFVTGRIGVGPRDFARASGKVAVKARWAGASENTENRISRQ